jgi:pyridoxamine 5'-phosphate oxidase
MDLRNIRQDYKKHELSLEMLDKNPFVQFEKWFNDATKDGNLEPTAFTLSSVSKSGDLSARIVLLKELKDEKFIFFTNYLSEKGQNIAENPTIHALFFWANSERQVRIKGKAYPCEQQISEEYFYSRPHGSQAAAIASQQSQVIDLSKDDLIQKFEQTKQEANLQKPVHWGGYEIVASAFEFWQGGMNRLHDRFRYQNNKNSWQIDRLAP